MTGNQARPRNEDDFGQTTTKQIADWLKEDFQNVSLAKSTYVSAIATNRVMPSSDSINPYQYLSKLIGNIFQIKILNRQKKRRNILHALMKLSNQIWALVDNDPTQRIHVFGNDYLAVYLRQVIRSAHANFGKVTIGHEPPEQTTFVFSVPGREYNGPLPNFKITRKQLHRIITRRDWWCVAGIQDNNTLNRIERAIDQEK